MAKDTAPPEHLVTTQDEVDRARDIVLGLPDGTLTQEERACALEAINRLGKILWALKICSTPVNRITAILRGGKARKGTEADAPDGQPAEADEQQGG